MKSSEPFFISHVQLTSFISVVLSSEAVAMFGDRSGIVDRTLIQVGLNNKLPVSSITPLTKTMIKYLANNKLIFTFYCFLCSSFKQSKQSEKYVIGY